MKHFLGKINYLHEHIAGHLPLMFRYILLRNQPTVENECNQPNVEKACLRDICAMVLLPPAFQR